MICVRSEHDLRQALAGAVFRGADVGFVPTMGALHVGHRSLVERARRENPVCAVSIFVNPLQFDDAADLDLYPRTEKEDLALLESVGVDVVLIGRRDDLYPAGFATAVEVGRVTAGGEGAHRAGHFRGVTTVVAKLLLMFQARRAYFGWKDMQQCCVIRRMVRDLSIPVEVVPCAIVREADGLASSSRNRRLGPEDRARAPRIFAALGAARDLWRSGTREAAALEGLVRSRLEPDFVVDYVEFRSEDDYALVADPIGRGRIVIAARLGNVRLLDNLAIDEAG